MRAWARRTLVVVGCAAALWGGSQAFGLAASEPPPPTPVAGEGKLASVLRTERSAARQLSATEREQASVSGQLDGQIASLTQEIATGQSMLSAASKRSGVTSISSSPAVQTVTGASGGGDDGSGGDD